MNDLSPFRIGQLELPNPRVILALPFPLFAMVPTKVLPNSAAQRGLHILGFHVSAAGDHK